MREPNFDGRLLKALRCEEPDRVPLLELWIDPRIKSGFLNKPIKDLPTDIEFWTKTSYDCIPLFPGYKLSRDFTLSPYEESSSLINDKERVWAEEKKGIKFFTR